MIVMATKKLLYLYYEKNCLTEGYTDLGGAQSFTWPYFFFYLNNQTFNELMQKNTREREKWINNNCL